jgi:ribosomal protein L23
MASRAVRRARKQHVATLSAQAHKSEAQRNITSLNQVDPSKIDRLTVPQLRQAAQLYGAKQEARKAQIVQAVQEDYYNVPVIHATKLDRELASRPLISDAEIASAPVKRQKTLRQQQRRRVAAREKLGRAREYNALRQSRTVEQQQWRERHGLDAPNPNVMSHALSGSRELRDMLNTVNVLNNPDFVKKMPPETLKRELKDAAKRVKSPRERERDELYKAYKKVNRERNKKRVKQKKTQLQYLRFLRQAQLKGALGKDVAHQFSRLSNKQVRWLMNNTSFGKAVRNFIGNSPEYESWETVRKYAKNNKFKFVSESENQKAKAKKQILDFFEMAKRH